MPRSRISLQSLHRHTAIQLSLWEATALRAFQKGYMIAMVERIQQMHDHGWGTQEDRASAVGLPIAFIQSVEAAYEAGTIDPEEIVDQHDLNREDLAAWRAASERQAIERVVEVSLERNAGKLPSWLREQIQSAEEPELQKWVYVARDYLHLDDLFPDREWAYQVLHLPPEPWTEPEENRGIRRALRLQIMERFGDIPYRLEEAIYHETFSGLLQLSRDVLHANGPEELLTQMSNQREDPEA